jgi:hypothetical protein
MDAGYLQTELAKVCPVIWATVVVPDDRNSWDYGAAPEATTEQIAAADNVMATIPIAVPGKASNVEFLARFTNAEYRGVTGAWRQSGGNGKNWDIVISDSVIQMSRQKVQTLKADLVAGTVLTQARADEIFK